LDGPGTIQITDRGTSHSYVDIGEKGRGVGDVDIYRMQLYNTRITKKAIGHAEMSCLSIGSGKQNCSATYSLPRGDLVAEGVIQTRLIYELAVVGGTGLYSNVRGALTVTSLGRKGSKELLVFRLTV
jgi:hypothetical protein